MNRRASPLTRVFHDGFPEERHALRARSGMSPPQRAIGRAEREFDSQSLYRERRVPGVSADPVCSDHAGGAGGSRVPDRGIARVSRCLSDRTCLDWGMCVSAPHVSGWGGARCAELSGTDGGDARETGGGPQRARRRPGSLHSRTRAGRHAMDIPSTRPRSTLPPEDNTFRLNKWRQ